MRKATSGLMLTEYENGSIRVEVVDYHVSEFDGCDWEKWYDIDKENAEKLKMQLGKKHSGTFQEMLKAEFGENFEIPEFVKFCKQNGIEYSTMSWISD